MIKINKFWSLWTLTFNSFNISLQVKVGWSSSLRSLRISTFRLCSLSTFTSLNIALQLAVNINLQVTWKITCRLIWTPMFRSLCISTVSFIMMMNSRYVVCSIVVRRNTFVYIHRDRCIWNSTCVPVYGIQAANYIT